MSGLWWVGFIQFIFCGLFAGIVFFLPKVHHFSSEDRPYILGIGIVAAVLSLFGLIVMMEA